MAIQTLPVVGDLGSQEFRQLVHSYNHLLDILNVFILGVSTAANTAAINALAVTALASLEADSFKMKEQPNVPVALGMSRV